MSEEKTKKEDGRIRYTKMRIRSAFSELLNETDFDKITVTSICNKAQINRATFYKHYLDVPDLVDKLQEDVITDISNRLANTDLNNIESFIAESLTFLKCKLQDKFTFKVFSGSSGIVFTSKISKLIYDWFSENVLPYLSAKNQENKDIVFAYISGGCTGIIDYWTKSGYKEKEEVIAHKIIRLAYSTLKQLDN